MTISNNSEQSLNFDLNSDFTASQDQLIYYFTQFNLLENITIDSLNEYTIKVLANNYKTSFRGSYDEGLTAYEDALIFIMNKHNEQRTNNI